MTPPTVENADCTNCDTDEGETAEFRSVQREHTFGTDETEAAVGRTLRCRGCGGTGTVRTTHEGTTGTGVVTFENAPWNSDSDESEESDE